MNGEVRNKLIKFPCDSDQHSESNNKEGVIPPGAFSCVMSAGDGVVNRHSKHTHREASTEMHGDVELTKGIVASSEDEKNVKGENDENGDEGFFESHVRW